MANEERFRRIGDYTNDRLLKDLQSLENEINRLRTAIEQVEAEKGDQGERGTPGLPGIQGAQGEQGEEGDRGLSGYSAYELDVLINGFAGTLEQWLNQFRVSTRTSEDHLYISVDRGSIEDEVVETMDYGSLT